ncbi:MAG: choice-of-anchor D domain-containing protein [Terriglobia bacterium]
MQKRGIRSKVERRIRGDFHASHIHGLNFRWHSSRLLLKVLAVAGIVSVLASCGGVGVDPPAPRTNNQISTLTISPASISFGNVKAGTTSAQTITLNNAGTASVTVSQASITGSGFSISGLPLPLTLAAGHASSFSATFSPATAGDVAGNISIVSDASNSVLGVPLSANGVTTQVAITPPSLNFGSVAVGANSSQPLTLTNTGTSVVTVSQITAAGTGFSVSGPSLPLTLAAGQSVGLTVAFSPATASTVSGSISILSDASSLPLTISLSGAGATQLLAVAPASLNFGSVAMGGNNSGQTITLSNTGSAAVTVSQANVAGAGFRLSGLSLPLSLGAGQSTAFQVNFSPTTAGSAAGSVSIISNASDSPLLIPVSGSGITSQLTASPASLNFSNVQVGNNSALPLVVTDTGSATVTISQATTSGAGFSVTGPALPLTLAAGQNTSFSVTFHPASSGSVTGGISVISNAANSPTNASLSATGVNQHSVTLTWGASTSSNITGYNVYRGTVSGGPYTKLNSSPETGTAYTDTTVDAGQTYYYVTTAVDSQGAESPNSNEAMAVIPSP